MLKVLAAVLAVLSAAISITLYSTTIPAIQKQAADNAAAIEQIESAVENIPTEKKLYLHRVGISKSYTQIYVQIYNDNNTQINGFDTFDTEIRRIYNTSDFPANGFYRDSDYFGNVEYGSFGYDPQTGSYPIEFVYGNIDTKTIRRFKIDNTFIYNDKVIQII